MNEEEHQQLIVDDEGPEVEIASDGRVTLSGEEIPDDVKVVEDNVVEEEPVSKSDEPEIPEEPAPEATETEEEKKVSAFEERFYADERLVKRFGTPEAMLERIPETDKYISRLEEERNYFRDRATPKEEPKHEAPSEEDFNNDPFKAIDRLIESRTAPLKQELYAVKYQNFVNSKPDFKAMEPLMEKVINDNPGLKRLGLDALDIAYKVAKAEQFSEAKPAAPQPAPTPKPDKTHAEAGSGKKKAVQVDKNSLDYWRGKTQKEIEEEVGFAPER